MTTTMKKNVLSVLGLSASISISRQFVYSFLCCI